MRDLPFSKGHGLGNDYLIVDQADLSFQITPAFIQAMCDRHRGAGSDGLLVGRIDDGKFHLRIYNPDGSEAEKSGNGLRIFGAYLYGRGLVKQDWFDVQLVKDTVQMRVEEELEAGALMIRAAMGRAAFQHMDHELDLQHGVTARVNSLSLSNPHCVVFVDDFDRDDFLERAPQLCKHPFFEAGTNVQFARVLEPTVIAAWIWERGVGETLASGSSSCAVAAAAVRRGFVKPGLLTVRMPGGDAEVEVAEDFNVKLRAPAQLIFSGRISAAVLEGW